MAQTLRRPLTPAPVPWVAALPVLLVLGVFLPVVPGLWWAFEPAAHAAAWQAFWADPQWPQAARASAVSALLGTLLAAALALVITRWHYPGATWQRIQARLPALLAMPHTAFAVGLFFLIAPAGWLTRPLAAVLGWDAPPDWATVQDPWGLSLALALGLKESWFLLWATLGVLGEQDIQRQLLAARMLGYRPGRAWRLVVWPQVLPRLKWPVLAAWAYGWSVVDMAWVLGPNTPPTLAVLVWQWLTDPAPHMQAQGAAGALVLLGLFAVTSAAALGLLQALLRWQGYPNGHRGHAPTRLAAAVGRALPQVVLGSGGAVVVALAVWSVAGPWFYPALWPQQLTLAGWLQADTTPLLNTFTVAAASGLFATTAAVAWLEWGPQRFTPWLYLPLLLPMLPLAAGQYSALVQWQQDGLWWAVVWAHLLWVLPYTLLMLAGPYRAFDPRLSLTARALGLSNWAVCWRVKWPLLLRPLLAALAVGFAVSVAQYLPTLFAGAGRWATVTTEAVALSAGGNRRVLATQALLQVLLPLLVFGLAAAVPRALARHRKGWR